MDYDPEQGAIVDFWQAHPEIPEPVGFTYSSRDDRRALDYCTFMGLPVTFEMQEGKVTQNRTQDGVIDILITKGPGAGLIMTHGHINPDTRPDTPGVQFLPVGTVVRRGDVLAYTDRFGVRPGSDPSTQTGLLRSDGSGYVPEQEMMLIGPDGQPNILYNR